MAMRWWWCSAPLLVLTAALACAPVARRWYVREAAEARMGVDELRRAAEQSLAAECRRILAGGGAPTGEALVVVEVDRAGVVQRARIDESTGDERLDDLFGTLATRLRLDRPTSMMEETAEGTVAIGYTCAPNAALATIRLNP